MSNIHHQLIQQSDLFRATITSYADKEKAFQCMLADKERTIKQLQIDNETFKKELSKAEEAVEQLKISHSSELADSIAVMDEKMRVKDEALNKLKEELTIKQNSLDVALSRHSTESDEWQKQTQEQLDKIITLEKEVAEKEEKLILTRNETFDLSNQLAIQSDLLSAEIAEKQEIQNVLINQEKTSTINQRSLDKLEMDNKMYKAELDDAKDLIQQLQTEQVSMKQKFTSYQNEMMEIIRSKDEALAELNKELKVKQNFINGVVGEHSDELEEFQGVTQKQVSILQKSTAVKDKELVGIRNKIMDLKHQLAQQANVLSTETEENQKLKCELTDEKKTTEMLQSVIAMYKIELSDAKELVNQLQWEQNSMKQQIADNKKEMIEKIRAKEEKLTKLEEELIIKQDSVADMEINIRRHTHELEEWQKESKEQSDKILSLQQEVADKREQLVITNSEITKLQHQLVEKSNLLSAIVVKYNNEVKAFEYGLADKEQIIRSLQSDIETYKAYYQDSMQQLQIAYLFEKQQVEKELMESLRMKEEEVVSLREQLTKKQYVLDTTKGIHSVGLMQQKKQFEEKLSALLTSKEEEIVAIRQEICSLEDQLAHQSNLLSAEVASKQALKTTLADKEKIISDLEECIVTYQTELKNAKYHRSQLEKEYLCVKKELADNKEKVTEKCNKEMFM